MKRASLEAQGKSELALSREALRHLVLRDEQAVFEDEPWLTFQTALYRRGYFFCSIGAFDLAREQAQVMAETSGEGELLERLRSDLRTLEAEIRPGE